MYETTSGGLARVAERSLQGAVVVGGHEQLLRGPAVRSGVGSSARDRWKGRVVCRRAVMEFVVQRADALGDGDVLRDLREARGRFGRATEQSARRGARSRARGRSTPVSGLCRRSLPARARRRGGRPRAPRRSGALVSFRRGGFAGAGPAARSWLTIRDVQILERSPGSRPSSSTSAAPVLVGLERLGLPSRPVERLHQLGAEALAGGLAARRAVRARRRARRGGRTRARLRLGPPGPPGAAPRAGGSRARRTARTRTLRAAGRATARERFDSVRERCLATRALLHLGRRAARSGRGRSLLPLATRSL